MLKMNEDLEGALEKYYELMQKGAFFEAHEVLEEAWHPLRLRQDPLANLVKGFINAAIALEHLKRARPQSQQRAKRVVASYYRHAHLLTPTIRHASLFQKADTYIAKQLALHQLHIPSNT